MAPRRFDALARTVAAPYSRRAALRRFGAGVAAALGVGGLGPARAQEATPAGGTPAAGVPVEFLYIQSFGSGTLTPKEGEAGVYELTVVGGAGHTVYFADRPARQTGIAPTGRVLTAVGLGGDDPPNAGLVAQTDHGERVVILELLAADLDEEVDEPTYDVRPLADYAEDALAHLADKHSDEELPTEFGPASLFIDGGGCPYPICGGICCDASQGMVCQGQGAYCVSIYQSGVCQGGNACHQGPNTVCNPGGTCHCGTDIEGGGACLASDPNLCNRRACSTSGDCAYGKLCVNAPCCGSGARVCCRSARTDGRIRTRGGAETETLSDAAPAASRPRSGARAGDSPDELRAVRPASRPRLRRARAASRFGWRRIRKGKPGPGRRPRASYAVTSTSIVIPSSKWPGRWQANR